MIIKCISYNFEFYKTLKIYDTEEDKKGIITDDDPSILMASFPSELMKNLKEAVELGDLDMFEKLNVEIQKFNSHLANKLEVLFSEFEYDKILEMIRETNEKRKK